MSSELSATLSSSANNVVRSVATLNAGIATLPPEMLEMIFDYLPVRARLRSVSFVCKRWRQCALRSITAVTLPLPDRNRGNNWILRHNFPAFLSRLPSLTALVCSSQACRTIVFPTTLRQLALRRSYIFSLCLKNIDATGKSLKFETPFTKYFPHLRELVIQCGPERSADYELKIDAFLLRHATQLTTFYMSNPTPSELLPLSLPLLTDLNLAVPKWSSDTLAELLQKLTSLRSLQLELPPRKLRKIPAPLLSSLIVFRASTDEFSARIAAHWLSLPKLRQVHGEGLMCESVRKLNFSVSLQRQSTWETLKASTNLDRLYVESTFEPPRPFPPELHLPYLTTLTFGPHVPKDNVVDLVHHLLPRCPSMSVLDLSCFSTLDVTALEPILQAAIYYAVNFVRHPLLESVELSAISLGWVIPM